jgi:hypothetical protein
MIATRTDSGYDLGMTRGDTETLTVTMTVEEDGETKPFDATEAVLTVRTSREGAIVFQMSATSVTDGVAVFDFAPELTASIDTGKYVYDIQATTADGVVKTPLGGLKRPCHYTLWQDVTYAD